LDVIRFHAIFYSISVISNSFMSGLWNDLIMKKFVWRMLIWQNTCLLHILKRC